MVVGRKKKSHLRVGWGDGQRNNVIIALFVDSIWDSMPDRRESCAPLGHLD